VHRQLQAHQHRAGCTFQALSQALAVVNPAHPSGAAAESDKSRMSNNHHHDRRCPARTAGINQRVTTTTYINSMQECCRSRYNKHVESKLKAIHKLQHDVVPCHSSCNLSAVMRAHLTRKAKLHMQHALSDTPRLVLHTIQPHGTNTSGWGHCPVPYGPVAGAKASCFSAAYNFITIKPPGSCRHTTPDLTPLACFHLKLSSQ
jgi:hypothetical protein